MSLRNEEAPHWVFSCITFLFQSLNVKIYSYKMKLKKMLAVPVHIQIMTGRGVLWFINNSNREFLISIASKGLTRKLTSAGRHFLMYHEIQIHVLHYEQN